MARRKTTFMEWLATVGVKQVSLQLNVTERTVYFWLGGNVKPGRKATTRILELAPHLSVSDIQGFAAVGAR